jgi:hypothetical protein
MTCGECKNWVPGNKLHPPWCDAPLPIWIDGVDGCQIRRASDCAGSCSCFERKEEK